jgi:hypothetical protein
VVHKLFAAHSAQVTRPHLLAEMRFACLAFSGDTPPPTFPDVRPRCSGCFWSPRAEKCPQKHEKRHLSGVFCFFRIWCGTPPSGRNGQFCCLHGRAGCLGVLPTKKATHARGSAGQRARRREGKREGREGRCITAKRTMYHPCARIACAIDSWLLLPRAYRAPVPVHAVLIETRPPQELAQRGVHSAAVIVYLAYTRIV